MRALTLALIVAATGCGHRGWEERRAQERRLAQEEVEQVRDRVLGLPVCASAEADSATSLRVLPTARGGTVAAIRAWLAPGFGRCTMVACVKPKSWIGWATERDPEACCNTCWGIWALSSDENDDGRLGLQDPTGIVQGGWKVMDCAQTALPRIRVVATGLFVEPDEHVWPDDTLMFRPDRVCRID